MAVDCWIESICSVENVGSPGTRRFRPSNLQALFYIHIIVFAFLLAGCPGLASEPQISAAIRSRFTSTTIDQAVVQARQRIQAHKKDSNAWAYLARALYRSGNFTAAEDAATHALTLNALNADALVVQARCLNTRGQNHQAFEKLEKAVNVDPLNPLAVRTLAGALDLNDDRKRVLELTRRFLELNPSDQQLFVRYLSKMIKGVNALKNTQLRVQPAWEDRPDRIALPLILSSSGPKVRIQFAEGLFRWCLFDTGEESLTVSVQTALKAKAKKLATVPAATATGIEKMSLALLDRVKAGPFQIANQLAAVGKLDIIGPSIFRGYRVKMDFMKGRLVLSKQPKEVRPGPDKNDLKNGADGLQRFRFRRLGNMIWLPIKTAHRPEKLKKRPAWGLLDSGCEPAGVLTPRYLNALRSGKDRKPLALPLRFSIGGAAGDQDESQLMQVLPQFRFSVLGNEVNADGSICAASITSICEILETELDLIIGWPVIKNHFRSVEIDFERCVLTIAPR